MKSPFQRRAAIAALLLTPALGGCGFGAQTDQVYQAAVGTNDRSVEINVLNAVIVSKTDGVGTFAGTLVNTTDAPVHLVRVAADGITATPGGGESILIPASGFNNLGAPGETVPPVKLALSGPAASIRPGAFVELTFTFSNGRSTTMKVPVVGADNKDYASVPLPAAPEGAEEPEVEDAAEEAPVVTPDETSDGHSDGH